MEKGYIHVYTGNGKGKTTAAFGLALRAHYAGNKVYIGQFVKDMKYNETEIQEDLANIKIEQLGKGCFIENSPNEEDKVAAVKALNKCGEILKSGEYDLVVLDEITIAIYFKLFSTEELIKILKNRNSKVEVVITGRYAPTEVIEIADLVTEMNEVKHYYSKGVMAREGIER